VGPSHGLGVLEKRKGCARATASGLVTVKVAGRGGNDPQCHCCVKQCVHDVQCEH
jgi:hypothetical protein